MPDETLSAPPTGDSDDERTLSTGQLLTPKYEIVRTLGSGGMGVVYEAKNLQTHARVAIKMLRRRAQRNEGAAARFAREARATGLLRSPHVARVLDADTTEDHAPFLVMELYEGTDLHSELHARKQLPIDEACNVILQACAGLAEAHAAGIVHRDLKPSNVFLAREGAERRVRILDFGVSKNLASDEELTHSAATLGTPSYMAPEQVRDSKNVDARADVWALGVILYRCVTGRPPFRGTATSVPIAIVNETPPSPRSLNAEVPAALEAAILHALEKDPNARFSSVAPLAEAIAPFADAVLARNALAEIALHTGNNPAARVSERVLDQETGAAVTSETRVARKRTWGIAAVVVVLLAAIAFSLRRPDPPAPAAAPTQPPSPSPSPSPSPNLSVSVSVSVVAEPSVSASAKPKPIIKPKPKKLQDPDLLP